VAFTYLKVKSAKCLCLLSMVLDSWSSYFGHGLGIGFVSSGLDLGLGLVILVLVLVFVLRICLVYTTGPR